MCKIVMVIYKGFEDDMEYAYNYWLNLDSRNMNQENWDTLASKIQTLKRCGVSSFSSPNMQYTNLLVLSREWGNDL